MYPVQLCFHSRSSQAIHLDHIYSLLIWLVHPLSFHPLKTTLLYYSIIQICVYGIWINTMVLYILLFISIYAFFVWQFHCITHVLLFGATPKIDTTYVHMGFKIYLYNRSYLQVDDTEQWLMTNTIFNNKTMRSIWYFVNIIILN